MPAGRRGRRVRAPRGFRRRAARRPEGARLIPRRQPHAPGTRDPLAPPAVDGSDARDHSSGQTGPDERTARDDVWAGLAIASILVWFVLLTVLKPGFVADERTHFPIIERLARGVWPAEGEIPMLPVAHLLAAGVMAVTGPSLMTARAVSAGLSIVATLLIFDAARQRYGSRAGLYAALFAWNPVFFPYSALVYTEPAAMCALSAGVALHARGRVIQAAVALLAACLIRQSNVVWIALGAVWQALEPPGRSARRGGPKSDAPGAPAGDVRGARTDDAPGTPGAWRRARGAWPYLLSLAAVAIVVALHPRLIVLPTEDNRPGFNPAQFYLFGFVVSVLWGPVWIARLRGAWRGSILPVLLRARGCLAVLACVALLTLLYSSPHHWNASPDYLHDRFLYRLQQSWTARVPLAALLVLAVPLIAADALRPGRPRMLAVAWSAGLLFLLPHRLVDHRYYIAPLTLTHCFDDAPREALRTRAAWLLALTAAAAWYTLRFGSPHSGL